MDKPSLFLGILNPQRMGKTGSPEGAPSWVGCGVPVDPSWKKPLLLTTGFKLPYSLTISIGKNSTK